MVQNHRQLNHAFNMGIDFTGGTSMILRFNQGLDSDIASIRAILNDVGLTKHTIQLSSSDLIIKTQDMVVTTRNQLFNAMTKTLGPFEILEVDIIGPSIGNDLKKTSWLIIFSVAVIMLLYCSWRFDFVFGVASVVALIHDALIVMACSAFFGIEINTIFVAALLTVLGYSINDTIVIFDRIRETMRDNSHDEAIPVVSKTQINAAINDVVPRSIHTSMTTGIVIAALLIFSGTTLQVFSTVLMIGVITGTYSSLCIAGPMILTVSKLKGVPVVK